MKVRQLQKGTKLQLTAGKRSAIVTNKSGVEPHTVSQALEADLAKSTTSSSGISSNNTILYEWCYNPDSKLSAKWTESGGAAVRCGLPGYDLSRKPIAEKLEGKIRKKLRKGQ
eukprot:1006704-Pyramimonas_sp.AAC.1